MSANKPGDPTTLNRLYGRGKGRPLRKGQQALVDELLPHIDLEQAGKPCQTQEELRHA